MNFAYHFEHDRYDWHLDLQESLAKYNSQLPPGVNISANDTLPSIHVTTHSKTADPIVQGYCTAKRYVGMPPASCKRFENITNFQLYEFTPGKSSMDTWCTPGKRRQLCAQQIEAHYQNFQKYYSAGWYDLDLERVATLEKVAQGEDTTCPRVLDFG